MEMIQDRKAIAKAYLSGWFLVDILAIIPFDLLMAATSYNGLVRVARFGKLYKLVKLTKLLRFLKIMKERNKLLRYLNEVLKIGLGFERLFFFILIFFVLIHIVSCLWVIAAALIDDETYAGTWLESKISDNSSQSEMYALAFYWTVTTITTVGYGDISGTNNFERMFCSIVMIVGVISFSFANGSLASII